MLSRVKVSKLLEEQRDSGKTQEQERETLPELPTLAEKKLHTPAPHPKNFGFMVPVFRIAWVKGFTDSNMVKCAFQGKKQ